MTVTISGTSGIVNDATDLAYTGTLTGGTGVVNLGSGQVYKDASGKVGIGTSSPGSSLQIIAASNPAVEASYAENGSGGAAYRGRKSRGTVSLPTAVQANDYISSVLASGYGATGWGGNIGLVGFRASENFSDTARGTAIVFENTSNGSNSRSERARIDSSGNLLVGTTTTLNSARATFSFLSSSGNTGVSFVDSQANSTASFASFYSNTTKIGSITNNGNTATAYNTSSDYRLKEAIAPMTGALARVAALRPCTYKWKVDGSDGQGFIAHELAEVVAGCVTGEKDAVDADGNPQYQGIDTSFLVATLAAAIQELKAVVDEQSILIASQAARITALEGTAA